MCIKNMISEFKDMTLDRSFTGRIGISGRKEPIKAVSFHKSCSTPLWKVILFMLGFIAGLMMLCCIKKKCSSKRKNECCEE